MKALKDYNEEYEKHREEWERAKYKTGIECPHCKGVEMKCHRPDMVLASYPPQKTIVCPNCNFRTNVFV